MVFLESGYRTRICQPIRRRVGAEFSGSAHQSGQIALRPISRANPDVAARVLEEASGRVSRQPIAGCIDSLWAPMRQAFDPTRPGEAKESFFREYPPLPPAIEETSLRSPGIRGVRQRWPNRCERTSVNPVDNSMIADCEDLACGVFMNGINDRSNGIADEPTRRQLNRAT